MVVARADLVAPPVCPLAHPQFVQRISANSTNGFVAGTHFVFLATQFQICHGNTAAFEHAFLIGNGS